MRITTNNRKMTIVFVFAIGIICLFSTFSKFSNTTFVYAKEQESEDVLDEQVIVDTSEVEEDEEDII